MSRGVKTQADLLAGVEYDTNGGCWLWLRGLTPDGYGKLNSGGEQLAHRLSWRMFRGDPGRFHVLHRCDVRACVNPAHLFLGTNADNVADKVRKGRAQSTPGESHPCARLTEAEVIAIRHRRGGGAPAWKVADTYGVSAAHVQSIWSGRAWSHLASRLERGQ